MVRRFCYITLNLSISERYLRCKLNDCGCLYLSIGSFEKHLSRWHVRLLDLPATRANDSTIESQVSDTIDVQGSSELIQCNDQTSQKRDILVKNFVHFCLKLKEKYALPIAAYKNIMNDLITLFSAFHSDIIQKLPVSFNENDDEWYLTDENFLPDLWNKLQNQTLFLNYCKSLGLVQPTTISLSDGSTFQYVSVLDTLVQYLQQPEVLNTVCSGDTKSNADCDILETFIDGNFFLNRYTSRVINVYLDFIYIVTNLNCAILLDLLEQSIKLLLFISMLEILASDILLLYKIYF